MAEGYLHFEVRTSQSTKRPGQPCGDIVVSEKNLEATTVIVCDGLGSGAKANVFATMCAARISELLKRGFSPLHAFSNVVNTMNKATEKDLPFAAFSLLRILNDGSATVLAYEMPPPILIAKGYSTVLNQEVQTIDERIVTESHCSLSNGEGILVVSDGITQAGIGKGLPYGWDIEGVNKYLNSQFRNDLRLADIPELVRQKAKEHWKDKPEDDCTATIVYARPGTQVNILTGAPDDQGKDRKMVRDFMSREGIKIVCGGTTAKIVARESGKKLEIEESFNDSITPPSYYIQGVDLVTEGAVTLNQLYNVWGVDLSKMNRKNPVTDLYSAILSADRINLIVGRAINTATYDISYRQLHILPRNKIIPLLIEKIRQKGKLVTLETV